MEFNATSFLVSLVVSSVGFVAFMYGKRQSRLPQMLVGIALMGFPYFVSNILVMLVIGAALLGVLWLMLRLGM
jgi:hypothetical protein